MTIEELRRARLAAKLEAMGGMGGYAEAKCKAEVEAEAKAEESPFFDPPVEIEPTRSTLDPPPAEAEVPKEEVIHPRTKADKPREELIATAPPCPSKDQEPQGGFGRIPRDVPPTRAHQPPQGGLRL